MGGLERCGGEQQRTERVEVAAEEARERLLFAGHHGLQRAGGALFQSVAHHAHAEQEHGQTAEQRYDVEDIHVCIT